MVYEGAADQYAIASISDRIRYAFDKATSAFPDTERQTVRLVPVDYAKVLEGVRRVSQYAGAGIHIELKTVPMNRVVSLTRFVREYKYRQIETLDSIYRSFNLPAFGPAGVLLRDGRQTSLVTPPVLEDNGGEFILIEGTTRSTFLRDRAADSMLCIVVKGVRDPLPADRVPFRRVRVVSKTLAADDRYPGFKYGRFRHIESSVRPIDSLQANV